MPVPENRRAMQRTTRTGALYAGLLAGNALAWAWAIAAFHGQPVLLGAAGLAYLLGLRHAIDADHIAAIDNVTRKLTAEDRPGQSVGLYFSLGHSTVVALAAFGVALASSALQTRMGGFRDAASVIGTSVSALFLLGIAAVNLVSFVSVWRTLRSAKRDGPGNFDLRTALPAQGLLARLLRPLLRMIAKSWHAYPLGFLFGLGFDTASEVGLLAISASQAGHGLALSSVMVFPALFAAGMSLLDTTDAIVMARLYGWAFASPVRTLYYNLGITFVSVAAAVLIGGLEALRLLSQAFAPNGAAAGLAGLLDAHTTAAGAAIIATALAVWSLSLVLFRRAR